MEQQSFWQFSDQLRLQTAALANLSTNDSIWSNSFVSKSNNNNNNRNNNFDVRVGAELRSSNPNSKLPSDTFNNDGWNSFKSGGSGLLSSGLNPMKEEVRANDFYGWNSFKPDLPNPIGSGTKLKDPANDYGTWDGFKTKPSSDYINGFNDGWKFNNNNNGSAILGSNSKEIGGNFSRGLYYKLGAPANNNGNSNFKGNRSNGGAGGGKGEEAELVGGKIGRKGSGSSNKVKNGAAAAEEKRFKTLPAAEALPRNEMIGGYIFVCNNDTMAENLQRQLFGLPPRYRDSVRAITPGLPLFLYNYSTHQLHGVFEAASFGGTNIDPTAWEDKKCPGESRFPAQVRVITRKICEPLEEDSFRPILHHYDGPKFRLQLSIPETISLLDVLAHQNP